MTEALNSEDFRSEVVGEVEYQVPTQIYLGDGSGTLDTKHVYWLHENGAMVSREAKVEGTAEIGPRCLIKAQAYIGHCCLLGQGVEVFEGSRFSHHAKAERRVRVEEGVQVHEFADIGTYAVLKSGVIIKRGAKIGERVVVLHNAEIGPDAVVDPFLRVGKNKIIIGKAHLRNRNLNN